MIKTQQKAFSDELQKIAGAANFLLGLNKIPIVGAMLRTVSPEMRRVRNAYRVWKSAGKPGMFNEFHELAQPALDRIDTSSTNRALRVLNSKGSALSPGQKIGVGAAAGLGAMYLMSPTPTSPQMQQFSALQQPYV